MMTDAERARAARCTGEHLADHMFAAGQADRLRELVACLMPLCGALDDALRAETTFDEALERARLQPSSESAMTLIAAGERLQLTRLLARDGLAAYRQLRELVLPRTRDADLRETLEALRRDVTLDRFVQNHAEEQIRVAEAEARNALLDEILDLLTTRGVLAPVPDANPHVCMRRHQ